MSYPIEPMPSTPCTLLQGMAREEGWYMHGDLPNRPQRNNNPLDLIYCDESKAFGAIKGDPRFAVFVNPEAGWEAARRWLLVPAEFENGKLVHGYCGATLEQLYYRFAPPTENQTWTALANLTLWTGLSTSTVVTAEMIRA